MKQLCGLIQKRLTLIEEVSKTKWNTKSSIEDAERERQILQDVAAKAESLGMSSTWVEHFFRMQIEASKVVEYQRFAEWHAENRGPFSATLDLKSEVRPRLDALSDALLKALHHNWKAISSATGAAQAESCRASDRFGLAFSVALTPLTDDSAETEAIFSQEIHTR